MNAPVQDVAVLILPGWQGSDAQHWQSRWEALYGYQRVQQHDWQHPRSGDWQVQLEEAVLRQTLPVVLVAHSLGCLLAARWAGHSRHAARVRAALLVAPPDTETIENRHLLPGWQPIPRAALPFASLVVASNDDPYCSLARARAIASDWGSQWQELPTCGHINSASGLGDWAAGHALLQGLIARTTEH
ncbi:serine hydrolase family protein [Corticibacter populi]|uniref:Serine hydrolase family protein n=1 Tax=Corticibacter populi TaxID=1550736 RepID=A0A3M6QP10_9BURK|nr:alpha/beta fold hydrolase [Corticibacter populi]RMX04786.1 serine hydrolase family protein [Corticibacter populi]RZS33802.1 hypothetical protein EV687_2129 [Corticibacter populi]